MFIQKITTLKMFFNFHNSWRIPKVCLSSLFFSKISNDVGTPWLVLSRYILKFYSTMEILLYIYKKFSSFPCLSYHWLIWGDQQDMLSDVKSVNSLRNGKKLLGCQTEALNHGVHCGSPSSHLGKREILEGFFFSIIVIQMLVILII